MVFIEKLPNWIRWLIFIPIAIFCSHISGIVGGWLVTSVVHMESIYFIGYHITFINVLCVVSNTMLPEKGKKIILTVVLMIAFAVYFLIGIFAVIVTYEGIRPLISISNIIPIVGIAQVVYFISNIDCWCYDNI